MRVNKSLKRIAFDVDNTIIVEDPKGSLTLAYGGQIKQFRPVPEHIQLLKHHKQNGYEVTVWSKNEWRWAVQVVQALNLSDYVDVAESKFDKFCDDKAGTEDIVGVRIFLLEEFK